jgi:hypothetical protein
VKKSGLDIEHDTEGAARSGSTYRAGAPSIAQDSPCATCVTFTIYSDEEEDCRKGIPTKSWSKDTLRS